MIEKQRNKKVFVFLGYGFGADSWQKRFARHEIPGLNEKLPYGYYHAAGDGWEVEYSQDRNEGLATRLLEQVHRAVLQRGLDLPRHRVARQGPRRHHPRRHGQV